jgi:hypothetical protein
MLARLNELKSATAPELKAEWRKLFASEPPAYNRRFLESRLAYRIQELEYGGLTMTTIQRLEALADALDGKLTARPERGGSLPVAGTRLVRDWNGVEHSVTVTQSGFEWQGRPFKSLSAIARAITGTRWNGWVFFGLKNRRGKA